ncbi:MAG: hypothetical protein JWN39_3599, partial [Ilumatobacteraceae bacterium]|nr:hypothetical protein [Ilumatobacteraceae bacterium]
MAETSARRVWCERALLADGVAEGVTIDTADGMITAVADRTDA